MIKKEVVIIASPYQILKKPRSGQTETSAPATNQDMPPPVKQDILKVIDELIRLVETKNTLKIKELSNHTIHNSSIYQDQDSVELAVLIYAFFKTTEREKDGRNKSRITGPATLLLTAAKNALEKGSIKEYRTIIEKLFKTLSSEDSRMKLFVEEVTRQARIKKGMKLYDHGISSERSAQVLGVSQWELMNYLGKTQVSETGGRIDVDERMRTAKKIFSIR